MTSIAQFVPVRSPQPHSVLVRPTLPAVRPTPARRSEDRQFDLMLDSFEHHGGIRSGNHIALMMRRRSAQPVSELARAIVERRVVCLRQGSELLVPLFQFDPQSMQLLPEASAVIAALAPAFDDWEVAFWFVQPNRRLDELAPIDVLRSDPQAVLEAAREDSRRVH